MKKIFREWGGTIVVVIAVVCLIGLVSILMRPGGVVDGAFSVITRLFVQKADDLVNSDWKGLSVVLDTALSEDFGNPTLVDDATLTISGKIAGAKGAVSLSINGTDVPVNGDGSWSASVTLTQGQTTEIAIVASDGQGNSTSQVVYVNYVDYELVALTSDYFDTIGYDTTVTDLVIPAVFQKDDGTWCKITSIGEYAFRGHTNLRTVKVPEGVTVLERACFSGCTGITSVGLSGSGADVELPGTLYLISYSAFTKCSRLTSVVIPKNVEAIYSSAFEKCSLLANVKFEAGSALTNIYEYAFSECPKLTSVGPMGSGCDFEIPDSLTSLYREVFSQDANITKFIIPDSMTSLDPDAFAMLTGLQAFEVGANNPAYCAVDGVLYSKDMKTLVRYPAAKPGYSFTVPACVTTIGKYAFEDSVELSNITLPSGLTTLSYYAFAFCYNLESITIPANVTYISSYAFYNCYNMYAAVFENPTGWHVSKNGEITDVDLSDSAVNAQSLRSTYVFHTWSRD